MAWAEADAAWEETRTPAELDCAQAGHPLGPDAICACGWHYDITRLPRVEGDPEPDYG